MVDYACLTSQGRDHNPWGWWNETCCGWPDALMYAFDVSIQIFLFLDMLEVDGQTWDSADPKLMLQGVPANTSDFLLRYL